MKTCPICYNAVEKFHKRSHMIPEWMYKNIYDEKHKLLEISKNRKTVTKKQKGFHRQFICHDCENETQKYDRYASLILTKRSPKSSESLSVKKNYYSNKDRQGKLEYEIWNNVDFVKFQKFVLSVILRTHLSGSMEGDIQLNQAHLNNILSIYHDKIVSDYKQYPVVLYKMPEDDPFRKHVTLPYFKKHNGHHIIEFCGAGYLFNTYVSSHKKPQYINSCCLKTNGSLCVVIMKFEEMNVFKNTISLFKAIGLKK